MTRATVVTDADTRGIALDSVITQADKGTSQIDAIDRTVHVLNLDDQQAGQLVHDVADFNQPVSPNAK